MRTEGSHSARPTRVVISAAAVTPLVAAAGVVAITATSSVLTGIGFPFAWKRKSAEG